MAGSYVQTNRSYLSKESVVCTIDNFATFYSQMTSRRLRQSTLKFVDIICLHNSVVAPTKLFTRLPTMFQMVSVHTTKYYSVIICRLQHKSHTPDTHIMCKIRFVVIVNFLLTADVEFYSGVELLALRHGAVPHDAAVGGSVVVPRRAHSQHGSSRLGAHLGVDYLRFHGVRGPVAVPSVKKAKKLKNNNKYRNYDPRIRLRLRSPSTNPNKK